jgi:hypothetical protein
MVNVGDVLANYGGGGGLRWWWGTSAKNKGEVGYAIFGQIWREEKAGERKQGVGKGRRKVKNIKKGGMDMAREHNVGAEGGDHRRPPAKSSCEAGFEQK